MEPPSPVDQSPRSLVEHAIRTRALGFNAWTSAKLQPGEPGYGGPGVSFIVRTLNPGRVVGVDTRYLGPALNGGTKLRRLPADNSLDPWYIDLAALQHARTVFVVESAINSLSIDTCALPSSASLAVRSINNVARMDWRSLRGKGVVVCFDNDQPDDEGRCADPECHLIALSLRKLEEYGLETGRPSG